MSSVKRENFCRAHFARVFILGECHIAFYFSFKLYIISWKIPHTYSKQLLKLSAFFESYFYSIFNITFFSISLQERIRLKCSLFVIPDPQLLPATVQRQVLYVLSMQWGGWSMYMHVKPDLTIRYNTGIETTHHDINTSRNISVRTVMEIVRYRYSPLYRVISFV